ncbi:MAG: GNAT family N-acetyltransferase [Simkaniaceae bacterium]
MAFIEEKEFDIRYSKLQDEAKLSQWLEDPATLRWFPQSSMEELAPMVRNWVGFSRFRASLTATYKEEVIGIATLFLMPYRKVAHMAMPYFVVDPKFRRKQVGHSLIKNIKHLAKTRFNLESLFLDLYEGCPAIEFLLKQGFTIVAEQDNFVHLDGKEYKRAIMEVRL